MSPEFSEYLPLIIGVIIAALVFILAFMWFTRRAKVITDDSSKDVLDEGAARAQRNEALINSARAVDPMPTQFEVPPPPSPEPAPEPAPAATATPAPQSSDDLTRIKGLGPKLAALLREQGITSYAQIAAWSDADIKRVDATLGRFAGRITRDQWVQQAKLLETGDETGFVQKFGQNG